MKLTPYEKVLTYAKEKIQEAMAPVRAREMRKKAELETTKIEGKIIEQEAVIQKLSSEYPVDFDKLIKALDEHALMERRKRQFDNIVADLFPQ